MFLTHAKAVVIRVLFFGQVVWWFLKLRRSWNFETVRRKGPSFVVALDLSLFLIAYTFWALLFFVFLGLIITIKSWNFWVFILSSEC